MEFNFRAVDGRSPPYFSPYSGVGNFYDQPFRGGYSMSTDRRANADPSDYREAIQRELEKERIREEIIAMEIARRRLLEAEVRRELMMEREVAMRRAADSGFPFGPRYPLTPHPVDGRFLEDHRWSHPGSGSFDMLLQPQPLQQRFPEAAMHEPNPDANKNKIIFLAKPEPNLSGTKRKAATPLAVGASELSTDSKKKPKEEWSCALCQVSATNKQGLNEHLKGKKHKAKEAGLRAQKAAKNSNGGQLPKKTRKLKSAGAAGRAGQEHGDNLDKETFVAKKNDKCSVREIVDRKEKKNKEMALQKKQNSKHLKKDSATKHDGEADTRKKKNFKYWCETCKVGVYHEIVFDTHKKGKKHMTLLKELGLNEAVPDSGTAPDTTDRKDTDTAEGDKRPAELVTADANSPDLPVA